MTSPALNLADSRSDKHSIELYLQYVLRCKTMPDGGPVHEAMRYSVLGAGQRIRPVLAVRTARMLGLDSPHVIRMAAAVELIHCASLVIDDLPCMDNEQERRGRPAVHIAFGEATAILAAFGLVALAGRLVLDDSGEEALPLQAFQSKLLGVLDVGGLIAGQSMDLAATGPMLHVDRLRINELKTVPLFDLSVRAALAMASLTAAEEDALLCFGRNFGIAFQMADDIADGDEQDVRPFQYRLSKARQALAAFGDAACELRQMLDDLQARAVMPLVVVG